MQNPVLVEVTRGQMVESRHRGMAVVVDGDGAVVMRLGEVETAVFPRSAVKSMQALSLVESGAADRYGFGDKELALACSSHSGEPEHMRLAGEIVARAGLSEPDLECGCHWSSEQKVLIGQARAGDKPNQFGNNCSGKHAGFLCLSCHAGVDHHGYVGYDHFVQSSVREVMSDLTGVSLGHDTCGTDGCSIPTYAAPLDRIAHGFARMASGAGLGRERAKAARRLMAACMAEPFYVAGTRRACTELMQIAPGRIFAKTGAEGVFCATIPEKGYGIALKCEDGSTRGAEVMIGAVLARLFADDQELSVRLGDWSRKIMRNWNGIEVGRLRPAGGLA
ncbi:asparaginase [Hoeflea sp. YIM 152468]|uniref:asparaginase n=1 Tax=Hoeflea sp. YIM 152468 TaxID=3031759 RepID=UPI0023DBCEAF|nr:asparaginase [Hoeflea sp. YIM 152468]MDF1608485.1 asparaginase [Hoeflea sp. YIM 152468]